MTTPDPRIVVTGLGAVSAWGWGQDALWQGLVSGETAISRLSRVSVDGLRTRVAAQVPPRIPPPSRGGPGDLPGADAGLSLADRFALAAAAEGLAQALGAGAPHGLPRDATGVFFGGSTAGMYESEEVFRVASDRPPDGRDLDRLAAQPIDNPAADVARHLGLSGPVHTVSSACASGTQALGAALDALRAGEVDVALAGGADSLCRLTYAGFNSLRVVDEAPCRPFRRERAGMSLGEGAGLLVLETAARAARRGARVLAELRGAGNSCDAHHMTAPHPAGLGAALAMERALDDAGARPEEVSFVNAHGTGTPLNDASEWLGMVRVFGDRASAVPVTATKASVGHLLGSSGAIEAVATVRCLVAGVVHPTPSGGEVDPETPAHLVLGTPFPLAAGADPWIALSTSFGFGGANAAAIFAAHPAEGER